MSAWYSWICPLFPVTQSFFDQTQLSVVWRGAVSLWPARVTHEPRWSSTGARSIWLMTGDQLSGNLNAVCFGIWFSMLKLDDTLWQNYAGSLGNSGQKVLECNLYKNLWTSFSVCLIFVSQEGWDCSLLDCHWKKKKWHLKYFPLIYTHTLRIHHFVEKKVNKNAHFDQKSCPVSILKIWNTQSI